MTAALPFKLAGRSNWSAVRIWVGIIAAASYETYTVLGKRFLSRLPIATVLAGYLAVGTRLLFGLKPLLSLSGVSAF